MASFSAWILFCWRYPYTGVVVVDLAFELFSGHHRRSVNYTQISRPGPAARSYVNNVCIGCQLESLILVVTHGLCRSLSVNHNH
jgi:hypothetical protein